MSKTTYSKAFQTLLSDFLKDIVHIFPEDKNIKVAKTSIETIQKANPAIVIRTWNKYITAKYGDVIEQGNLQYFIEKDYSEDLQKLQNSSDIVKAIDMLRTPIKNMSDTNQKHTLEYLQKLCKLSAAYASLA
tara:strand:- start:139 stop:534 length:396 start_codon:yes stop_codon:yes gene_type:complete